MMDMPYFLKNEEWYTERLNNGRVEYTLTDKAPKKAVDSYKQYHDMLRYAEENNIDL